MKRYLVAFASVLIGMILTTPFAILKFRELPAKAPQAAKGHPGQMSSQEMLCATECCVMFYAVTYFVGKRIYSKMGQWRDLQDIQQFSETHLRLLHTFGGAFMVASPWIQAGPKNPWTTGLAIAIGFLLLASGIWAILGWIRRKLTQV